MAVRRTIPIHNGIFFITFTCVQWIPLIEITNAYAAVYRWFDYLKEHGHFITGYVIMPNHLHSLIAFSDTKGKSINKIIGNGKRFLAYDIVARLDELDKLYLLRKLESKVSTYERTRNKQHEVFEPSFDWKLCWSEEIVTQKLDYIHNNPIKGKWHLADEYWEYPHSSALYYTTGRQGVYPVTHYGDINAESPAGDSAPD